MNEQLELLQTIPGVGKDGAIYESMVGRRGEKKAFLAIGHII